VSPSGRTATSSSNGLSAQTSLALNAEEGNYSLSTNGTYRCSCIGGGTAGYGGSGLWPFGRFQAPLKYDHYESIKQKHVYRKDSAYCNGTCQPSEWCSTSQYAWIYLYGWRFSAPSGFTQCVVIPPYPRGSTTRPECKQTFGVNLLTINNEC